MPRLKRYTRANGRNIERQRAAWELYRAGASCSEIGRALGVHRSHAHRLVATERDRLSAEVRASAEEWRAVELSRADLQIREASRIVLMRCVACGGSGRIMPDGPATLPGQDDGCLSCDASGRKHGPDTVLRALDRLHRAVEQRCKILGLYSDNRAIVDVTVVDGRDARLEALLAGMSDDELRRELDDLDGLPVRELAPSEPLLDRALDPPRLGYPG